MRYLRFLLPLVLVVVADVLFQRGIWERIASPQSHAGMSIAKKRAVMSPDFSNIDFIALGSSRPVYGFDHVQLARIAAEHHATYANLTIAGTHWMSLGVITRWLAEHHPEIRAGVIGLSVQDFLSPGNGSYELGIAYPFHSWADIPMMAQHVRFDWHEPGTYGLYSGLFAYHEDVQDMLAHPLQRRHLLQYFHALPALNVLTGNADETADVCGTPVRTLDDCSTLLAPRAAVDARITAQCRQLRAAAGVRPDLRPFLHGGQPNEALQKARDLIRSELGRIVWPTPPLVVLMPMPPVWANEVMPPGAHEWALSVLEPLVAAKKIRVLDYTNLFDGESDGQCKVFFDLYHNNVAGRERVMARLLPEIEQALFARTDAMSAEKN